MYLISTILTHSLDCTIKTASRILGPIVYLVYGHNEIIELIKSSQ